MLAEGKGNEWLVEEGIYRYQMTSYGIKDCTCYK